MNWATFTEALVTFAALFLVLAYADEWWKARRVAKRATPRSRSERASRHRHPARGEER